MNKNHAIAVAIAAGATTAAVIEPTVLTAAIALSVTTSAATYIIVSHYWRRKYDRLVMGEALKFLNWLITPTKKTKRKKAVK